MIFLFEIVKAKIRLIVLVKRKLTGIAIRFNVCENLLRGFLYNENKGELFIEYEN